MSASLVFGCAEWVLGFTYPFGASPLADWVSSFESII